MYTAQHNKRKYLHVPLHRWRRRWGRRWTEWVDDHHTRQSFFIHSFISTTKWAATPLLSCLAANSRWVLLVAMAGVYFWFSTYVCTCIMPFLPLCVSGTDNYSSHCIPFHMPFVLFVIRWLGSSSTGLLFQHTAVVKNIILKLSHHWRLRLSLPASSGMKHHNFMWFVRLFSAQRVKLKTFLLSFGLPISLFFVVWCRLSRCIMRNRFLFIIP